MYASLGRLDMTATDPKTGITVAVLTDHRKREEIEAEPELSVLFALARVVQARGYTSAAGNPVSEVIYNPWNEPPPFLLEALGATGAVLEIDRQRSHPPSTVTRDELAERAFTALAERVGRRCGLTDMATVLRALEAETLASPPDKEDETAYWTRVLELMAVATAMLRKSYPGRWIMTDKCDIPFAFQFTGDNLLLPANRARRFLADGETESMFLLVTGAQELSARHADDGAKLPIMPCLRARDDAEQNGMLWKPLLDKSESDTVPVIAYGRDGENTIGWLRAGEDAGQLETAHQEAMANIARHEVEIEDVTEDIVAVTGSYFATEKVLDPAFMRQLHRRFGELLCAGVPRRGLMFVAGVGEAPAVIAATAAEYDAGGTRKISPNVLAVHRGQVVGLVRTSPKEKAADPEPAKPEEKKPGFWRRLFGGTRRG